MGFAAASGGNLHLIIALWRTASAEEIKLSVAHDQL